MYTSEEDAPPTYEVLRESAEGELQGGERGRGGRERGGEGEGKNFRRKVFNEKESSLNGTKSRARVISLVRRSNFVFLQQSPPRAAVKIFAPRGVQVRD